MGAYLVTPSGFCLGWVTATPLHPNLVSFQTQPEVTSSGKPAPVSARHTPALPQGSQVTQAWLRSEAPGHPSCVSLGRSPKRPILFPPL